MLNTDSQTRNRIINANQEEYGPDYQRLQWLLPEQALNFERERSALLQELSGKISLGYHDTKLDCRRLSPGCIHCGNGDWSCLFIAGRCNCGCFYCPTAQDDDGPPVTQTVPFTRAVDYADYLAAFNYKGVGLSGGEPFLVFERALQYLKAIKGRFGSACHVWLYTNGSLVTTEKLKLLADAGLDEIRFDIGAVNYQLAPLGRAVGIIPVVTVEIPMIPEDYDLLKQKVLEMQAMGVNFLNLHQLRLTPYNSAKLIPRDYTYLHGEKVTVLASELAALRLLHHTVLAQIDLPINYCSFVYKHRHQGAAARKKNARLLKKAHEDITENGFIRALCLKGSSENLGLLVENFGRQGLDPAVWSLEGKGTLLFVGRPAWPLVDFTQFTATLTYYEAALRPQVSYRHLFKEIRLNKTKSIVLEKRKTAALELSKEECVWLGQVLGTGRPPGPDALKTDKWREVMIHEFIPQGLQEYF